MSSGTPVAGGIIRQRHSQGYASSGDDLEDDASSRAVYFAAPLSKSGTWLEILESFLWIASAIFFVYYGDKHSNFIYLLWHDDRIRRIPLYIGLLGVALNVLVFLYRSMLTCGTRRLSEKWEISSMAVLPFVTMLGLTSFCIYESLVIFIPSISSLFHSIFVLPFILFFFPGMFWFRFSLALWPIWSFLTLPLVFTLFMSCMVILPHLILGTFRPQPELMRID